MSGRQVDQETVDSDVAAIMWVTHAHTHPFNGPFSGTTRVSQYQKGKTNLDFTEARDSEWQWHQLAICKSASRSRQITMPVPHHSSFLQAGCPYCRLKACVYVGKTLRNVCYYDVAFILFIGKLIIVRTFSETN